MSQPIWSTPSGNIGAFVSNSIVEFQLSAIPVLPATTIAYRLISGSLPEGITLSSTGLLAGTAPNTLINTSYTFVVRATDNNGNIRDRTFVIVISGIDIPSFISEQGTLFVTYDSEWVEYQVEYSVPVPDTPVLVTQVQGQLPPGLEINEYGLIRGYPKPPIVNVNLGSVSNAVIAIVNNNLIADSTVGFSPGRPIVFFGTVFGGINPGQTYYVREVLNSSTFTISTTVDGPVFTLSNSAGYMDVNLPNISVGQPTIQSYEFTLRLTTNFGTTIQNYSITVVNQNATINIGGPGRPFNTRTPTILNTRPATYNIDSDSIDYPFYLIPPDSKGITYSPTEQAIIGKTFSDNQFAFRILGKDFDDNEIEYIFADLPLGLVGDTTTGWITGNPIISNDTISQFNFSVAVNKKNNPTISSSFFSFAFTLTNNIDGQITWVSQDDLGIVFNGTTSILKVEARSDVELKYTLVNGTLPANLTLQDTGDITGIISFQPNAELTYPNESTEYNFTIRAYSPNFPIIFLEKQFKIVVKQLFPFPTDTLYIKCTPNITDRRLLETLLTDNTIIPQAMLYRPNDGNFGKANSVIYEHAFGINSSSFDEYVAAVTKNHYWRRITLGEIKTAVARNEQTGEIIYEVVYSSIIDNLVNPENVSVSKEVFWPRFIPLNEGQWYTSSSNIFTSYIGQNNQIDFYTSLTPGFARLLYPNSLPNMRQQVGDVLGTVNNTNILPLWMTSQQRDGNTLGFTPAWVICYTKPGFAEIIKNNIENNWKNPVGQRLTLNQIDFEIDRFTVSKINTFNYDNNVVPPAWTSLPSGSPVPDPTDSKDFYVLFPRQTILPNQTQYPR
jgi:hypothetical protein